MIVPHEVQGKKWTHNSHAKHTFLKMWDKMKTSLKGKFKLATMENKKMFHEVLQQKVNNKITIKHTH